MDWILHLNIHSTVRQETQALGHNRSFARRAKTQLFRERESPNETALKLPASIAAPCCLSPLTPLHVRPSHMRRETKPLRGMGTTTAPQARGRARCCSACSHRGASAAAPALRGRCAASVRGRPRGRLFSLRPIGSLYSAPPLACTPGSGASPVVPSGPLASLDGWGAHKSGHRMPLACFSRRCFLLVAGRGHTPVPRRVPGESARRVRPGPSSSRGRAADMDTARALGRTRADKRRSGAGSPRYTARQGRSRHTPSRRKLGARLWRLQEKRGDAVGAAAWRPHEKHARGRGRPFHAGLHGATDAGCRDAAYTRDATRPA